MRRAVATLNSLGVIEVLTAAECDRVAALVLDSRADWTARSPSGLFSTLGVNAYMDLAPTDDPDGSYFTPARASNTLLQERFRELHQALARALEAEIGLPARYADDLARPGFHIWSGLGIPRTVGASVHFDLQYLKLLTRPHYAGATGTVSFTLPIRLPAAGSSLRVWPDCQYPIAAERRLEIQQTEPEIVEYTVGRAVLHSGHVLHQIGATPTVTPDDLRITLQGHGLVVDETLVLYW
jgi:hypothetical protein